MKAKYGFNQVPMKTKVIADGEVDFLYEGKTSRYGWLDIQLDLHNDAALVTPEELAEFGRWLVEQFTPRAKGYVVDEDVVI